MKTDTNITKDDRVEFKIKLHDIQRLLNLDSSYKFIHLLNGDCVFSFAKVALTERIVIIGITYKNREYKHVNRQG